MSVRDGGRACYVGIASATTKAEVPKLVVEDVFSCWRCVFSGDVCCVLLWDYRFQAS